MILGYCQKAWKRFSFEGTFSGRDRSVESRAIVLLIGAAISLSLLFIMQKWFYGDDGLSNFQILLLGLPIAFFLWVFRTRDVTENLRFNSFSHAAGMLKDIDNILAIETGVSLLIKLSEQTNLYDDDIEIAFLNLLKAVPSIQAGNMLGKELVESLPILHYRVQITRRYAQRILEWLDQHERRISREDAKGLCLFGQEFDLNDGNTERLNEICRQRFGIVGSFGVHSSHHHKLYDIPDLIFRSFSLSVGMGRKLLLYPLQDGLLTYVDISEWNDRPHPFDPRSFVMKHEEELTKLNLKILIN